MIIMEKEKVVSPMRTIFTLILCIALLSLSPTVNAKSKVVPIEGVSYNVEATMADNLQSLLNKKVSVTLDSGKIITGFIKFVGNHMIHLEKLDGKEYFDALILIEDISAIDTKFRDLQR
jgi:hypothetical protein